VTDDCRLLKKAIYDFAASSALCDEILAVAPAAISRKLRIIPAFCADAA
jgi:hypothetical protein